MLLISFKDLKLKPMLNSSTTDERIDYFFSSYQKEKNNKIGFVTMTI
jgi:hypothetical protein